MTAMPSSAPAPANPQRDEAIRALTPYEVSARITLGLSAPAAVTTPLVRRLLGRSGVQVGPSVLSVVNALVNIALIRTARRRGLSLDTLDAMSLSQRRLAVALIAWALVGPAVAAFPEQTVILRGRSPTWALPMDMAPRLALGIGIIGVARRRLHRTGAR